MSNPKIIAEGFTCEELAEALMVRLKPFILESIQEGLANTNEGAWIERSKDKVTGLTSDEPQVSDTGRYSVAETAKALGIHRTTLFHYSMSSEKSDDVPKKNLIKCGIRKSNGRRFYTGAEIKRFWKATY